MVLSYNEPYTCTHIYTYIEDNVSHMHCEARPGIHLMCPTSYKSHEGLFDPVVACSSGRGNSLYMKGRLICAYESHFSFICIGESVSSVLL